MSKDTVRRSEFGKDHGLIHEVVVAGRQAGAGEEFYAALAHDRVLFRRIVKMVEYEKQHGARNYSRRFMDALSKGISIDGDTFRFWDPGIPMNNLPDLPMVRDVLNFDYHQLDWAKQEELPCERFIRILGRTSADEKEQESTSSFVSVRAGEESPTVRILVTFCLIALLTNKAHLESFRETLMDTIDEVRGRGAMYVSFFEKERGFERTYITVWCDASCGSWDFLNLSVGKAESQPS